MYACMYVYVCIYVCMYIYCVCVCVCARARTLVVHTNHVCTRLVPKKREENTLKNE